MMMDMFQYKETGEVVSTWLAYATFDWSIPSGHVIEPLSRDAFTFGLIFPGSSVHN